MPPNELACSLTQKITAPKPINIAQGLIALDNTSRDLPEYPSRLPLIDDWSTTLVPFPAIIGSIDSRPFLEPVFGISVMEGLAVTADGLVRLNGSPAVR